MIHMYQLNQFITAAAQFEDHSNIYMYNVYSTYWNVTDLKLVSVFGDITPRSRFLRKRISAVVSLRLEAGVALVA